MNLHDIVTPMAHIDLIRDYCTDYYHMEFVVHTDGRSLDYRSHAEGSWSMMTERDTLSYTNQALEWDRDGRPARL